MCMFIGKQCDIHVYKDHTVNISALILTKGIFYLAVASHKLIYISPSHKPIRPSRSTEPMHC